MVGEGLWWEAGLPPLWVLPESGTVWAAVAGLMRLHTAKESWRS